MDVVYPIGKECGWGHYNELRYSLRSLKFLDHNRVFIIGQKPDWIQNIIHIPFEDCYAANKDANMIQKILRACYDTSKFIRMSDDQYFLKPYRQGHYHCGNLKDKKGDTGYDKMVFNTVDILNSKNLPTLNYDTHTPVLIDKDYPHIMLQCPYGEGIGVLANSYYFNHLNIEPTPVSVNRFLEPGGCVLDKDFLNFNDKGLTDDLKKAIHELFPDKSRYES